LTSNEIKKFLSLRVDFDAQAINSLQV
jgi:hypothetical protein